MKKKTDKTMKYMVVVFLILLAVSFFISKRAQQKEKASIDKLFNREITLHIQEFKDQGVKHISKPGLFQYNSNPPTSGPHYAQAPSWGFYSEPIDDESALHAVEHGGLWVSYKNLNEEEIAKLKKFADKNPQSVIVTPREKNDTRVAAVMWTKLITFDGVDVDALQKFLLLNKNKTHEPLAK